MYFATFHDYYTKYCGQSCHTKSSTLVFFCDAVVFTFKPIRFTYTFFCLCDGLWIERNNEVIYSIFFLFALTAALSIRNGFEISYLPVFKSISKRWAQIKKDETHWPTDILLAWYDSQLLLLEVSKMTAMQVSLVCSNNDVSAWL